MRFSPACVLFLIAWIPVLASACTANAVTNANEHQSFACASGKTCECDTNGGCDVACAAGGCVVECNGNGGCAVTCDGGNCSVHGNGNGGATLSCKGGNCKLECLGAGGCVLTDCAGGGCTCGKLGGATPC